MPDVRGYAALFAPRGLRGRRAGPRCRCAMVVVLSQPWWVAKGPDMSESNGVTMRGENAPETMVASAIAAEPVAPGEPSAATTAALVPPARVGARVWRASS